MSCTFDWNSITYTFDKLSLSARQLAEIPGLRPEDLKPQFWGVSIHDQQQSAQGLSGSCGPVRGIGPGGPPGGAAGAPRGDRERIIGPCNSRCCCLAVG